MPTATKKFLDCPETIARIEHELEKMVANPGFSTESSYSANVEAYPDHLIPFVAKHMAYLHTHPKVNPDQYLSNLRMMTKVRV